MDNDRFLSRSEAAEYLTNRGFRIAKQTLARIAITSTEGPIYRVFGTRAIYRVADLDVWAEARASKPRRCSFEGVAA